MQSIDYDSYLNRLQQQEEDKQTDYEDTIAEIIEHDLDDIEKLVKEIESKFYDIVQYYDTNRCLDVEEDVREMIKDMINEYL